MPSKPTNAPASQSDSSQSAPSRRVYAVHLRLTTHPRHLSTAPQWTEPPIGLGFHRGHYEIIGQAARLDALTRWALRFGACAEVLGPTALRARMAREARRIASRYDGLGDSDDWDPSRQGA
jgi:predicted DNA-binding transcriptional regulator YafY